MMVIMNKAMIMIRNSDSEWTENLDEFDQPDDHG